MRASRCWLSSQPTCCPRVQLTCGGTWPFEHVARDAVRPRGLAEQCSRGSGARKCGHGRLLCITSRASAVWPRRSLSPNGNSRTRAVLFLLLLIHFLLMVTWSTWSAVGHAPRRRRRCGSRVECDLQARFQRFCVSPPLGIRCGVRISSACGLCTLCTSHYGTRALCVCERSDMLESLPHHVDGCAFCSSEGASCGTSKAVRVPDGAPAHGVRPPHVSLKDRCREDGCPVCGEDHCGDPTTAEDRCRSDCCGSDRCGDNMPP